MDGDLYPPESGRRRFVKGIVGGSALGGLGAAGASLADTATSLTGHGGGSVEAMVIENTAGPAPRGMSQIPVAIEDGYVTGVWPGSDVDGDPAGTGSAGSGDSETPPSDSGSDGNAAATANAGDGTEAAVTELGGVEYSSQWFQYCGVQTHPKIDPTAAADDVFRAADDAPYDWQSEVDAGTRLTVDHFADYETWDGGVGEAGLGKPAAATWRSADTEATIPVQVLRSRRIEALAEEDEWLAASTEAGFIAWLNKCTHFCCVPIGYQQTTSIDGAENAVYCQCHQSTYDPLSVTSAVFTAKPRPEE